MNLNRYKTLRSAERAILRADHSILEDCVPVVAIHSVDMS